MCWLSALQLSFWCAFIVQKLHDRQKCTILCCVHYALTFAWETLAVLMQDDAAISVTISYLTDRHLQYWCRMMLAVLMQDDAAISVTISYLTDRQTCYAMRCDAMRCTVHLTPLSVVPPSSAQPSIYWPNLYITIAMLLLHFESLSKKIHVCK